MTTSWFVFTVDGISKPVQHHEIQLRAVLGGLNYTDVPKELDSRTAFTRAVTTLARMNDLSCVRTKDIKSFIAYRLGDAHTITWSNNEGIETPDSLRPKLTALHKHYMGMVDETAWGKAVGRFMDNNGAIKIKPEGRVWWLSGQALQNPLMGTFMDCMELAGIKLVAKPVTEDDMDWLVWKICHACRAKVKVASEDILALKRITGKYAATRRYQAEALGWTITWLMDHMEEDNKHLSAVLIPFYKMIEHLKTERTS